MKYKIYIIRYKNVNLEEMNRIYIWCLVHVAHETFFTVLNERSLFRGTSQQVNEKFITRLRERAVYCKFGAAQDEMIRDKIIEHFLKCDT